MSPLALLYTSGFVVVAKGITSERCRCLRATNCAGSQPVSPLRGPRPWARGNHDVRGPCPSCSSCWSRDRLLGANALHQACGTDLRKTFENLPVIYLPPSSNRTDRSRSIYPRDPRLFFSSGSLSWFADSHLCLLLHLLTIPFIATDIVTRYLFLSSVRTIQAHPRIPGHERSLTQIKFNKDGDLLFSCSKDHVINVWFSHNGERLGTYDGHNGTVWTIDVDCTSPAVLHSSSVDMTNRPTSTIQISRVRIGR